MDFANFLVFVIFATNFIEISTASSWEPNVRKYESYDLEKGPVFYEAYYPDEKTDRYTRDSKNLQEKRFFDRGTVLEKVFQIPTDELRARYPYSDNVQRIDDRLIPIGRGELFYDRNPEGYPPIPSIKTYEALESTDIEDLSSNTANNYPRYLSDNLRLDDGLTNGYRTTRQLSDTTDPLLRTRPSLSELENLSLLENILEDQRSKYLLQRRPRYLEDRKNTANDLNIGSDVIVSSLMPKKNPDPISGLFGEKEEAQTQNEQLERLLLENSNLRQKEEEIALETARNRILNLARLENIFEPRPQIINYVFSKNNVKKSPPGLSQKMLSNNLDREMHKNVSKKNSESVSTNYGNNNLIRDELKREPQGREDAKVTSIVISETPEKPHKIRHHHGERPKRDWSHRHHQTSLPALKT